MRIEITMSHLFSVAETDIERFRKLGVHANFTPHWFAGTAFGKAGEINLAPERGRALSGRGGAFSNAART